MDFCHLFVEIFPALSKTSQGRLGFYQTLKNFKSKSIQSLLGPSDFFTRALGHPIKPLSGQDWFLSPLCRNCSSPIKNLSGPIGILSNPEKFQDRILSKLTGPIRLFHKASWASYETLIRPSWIFVDSLSKFSQPSPKPMRADWDFIKPQKFQVRILSKPIGPIRLFHKAFSASYRKVIRPR